MGHTPNSIHKYKDTRTTSSEAAELLQEVQVSLDMAGWEYDQETNSLIPAPIREYPPVDYRRVQENE